MRRRCLVPSLLLVAALGGGAAVAAQDHGGAAKEPAHAAPARGAAVAAPAGRAPAAGKTAKEAADDHETKEPVKPHGDGKTATRPTVARPASNRELDLMMERISRRISGASGDAERKPAAVRAADSGTAAPSPAAPPARLVSHRTPRVELVWRPSLVWPEGLLAPPSTTKAVAGDGRVILAWEPAVE